MGSNIIRRYLLYLKYLKLHSHEKDKHINKIIEAKRDKFSIYNRPYGGFHLTRSSGSFHICLGWVSFTVFLYDVERAMSIILGSQEDVIDIKIPNGFYNCAATTQNEFIADTNSSENWQTISFPLPTHKNGDWIIKRYYKSDNGQTVVKLVCK